MKKGKTKVADAGNGLSIRTGPWRQLVAASDPANGTAGGTVPTEVVVLPFPEWELEDCTLITDAKAQQLVMDDIRDRQLDIVFDYHHHSVHAAEKGYLALAAGWLPWQEIVADERGIVAKVRWTPRATEHLAAGEFRYFSPVVLYDEKTSRVIALLSVALTNTPRTNKQAPLTAELAASIVNNSRRALAASMEGGSMKKWVQILCSFLDSTWCYDPKELLAHIDKARDQFVAVMSDELSETELTASQEFAASLPQGATILQVLVAGGLTLPEETVKALAAAHVPALAGDVAPAELLKLFELPAETTLTELKAHVIDVRTSSVPRAELQRLEAELESARGENRKSRVDQLLASYADRFAPAEESELRKFAELDFAATEASLKKRQPIVTASKAASVPPLAIATPVLPAASTRNVGDEAVPVDPDSATLAASVQAIQAEAGGKFATYEAAYTEYKRRASISA